MQLGTILKILAAGALAIAVALIAAGKAIDMERTKAMLAKRLAAAGMRLDVSGPIKLRLGFSPQVIVTGLTLTPSNAPAGAPPLLSVDRIEAQVALLPAVFRELRADRVRLIRPTVRLAPGQLSEVAAAALALARLDLGSDRQPGVPTMRSALSEIRIEGGQLDWLGKDRPTARIGQIDARLRPEFAEGGPVALTARAEWEGAPVEITGRFGPFATAGGPTRPMPLHLKAGTANTVLVAHGALADPTHGEGLEVALNAQGDDMGTVARAAGLFPADAANTTTGPFKLAARLRGSLAAPRLDEIDAALGRRDTVLIGARGSVARLRPTPAGLDLAITAEAESLAGPARLLGVAPPAATGALKLAARLTDAEGGWRLAGLKSQLGTSDLAGTLVLTPGAPWRLSGRLGSAVLVPGEFAAALLGEAARPAESARPAARPAIPVADGRILSPDPLPFDRLGLIDLDLDLSAQHLVLGKVTLTDAQGHLRLDGGTLSLDAFAGHLGNGTLEGEARIEPGPRLPALSARLSGHGLDLDRIAPDAGLPVDRGRLDLALDLRAQGDSPRLIAGSLAGTATLSVGPTRLDTIWAGGVPARLLAALDPLTGDLDPIPLGCLALRVSARDGMVAADRGLAIETGRVGLLGSGVLDLRSERLDLVVGGRTTATRLKGMLGNPALGGSLTAAGPFGRPPARPAFDPQPCRAVAGRH